MNSHYDLFSRQFKHDPFPTFAEMRQNVPIYRHDAPNGLQVWYFTRYEDVAEILKDDENFCKNLRNALPANNQRRLNAGIQNTLQLINQNMLFADPPNHTRLRALVSQAFTPSRVQQLTPKVTTIADELLAKVLPNGGMDVINDYALPLPFTVITELLGVPLADRPQVKIWSQAIIAPGSRGIKVSQRKRWIREFVAYVSELFLQRQQEPKDDLLTALVQAEEAGEKLTDEELYSMVMLLLVTGYETTVNLIGNGVYTLIQHPEQLALLQENPTLMPSAIEEILRFDGPVETSTSRWARHDVTYKGHQIKRGDMVRVVLSSANRDEEQFVEPTQFNLQRDDNRHLAFGLGIHYCLGAPLARLEGEIALSRLFEQCRHLRLAVPANQLEWRSGVLFRGLKTLPVQWDS